MPHPRCRVIPLPDHQVSFTIDDVERLRWHHGPYDPRPFFYPLNGPSGRTLTRMGHPGAPNHDHHRSVWFAHHKVLGISFWSDETDAIIRQQQWLRYRDGDDESAMACLLNWSDGHDPQPLLTQELIVFVRPASGNGTFLEVQATFTPTAESLEFQQTNFGFFAVRVAKEISGHFGTGTITNSEGAVGEKNSFGKPARWMDYSGEIAEGVTEGITYFDHPSNPGQPTGWHVREDGWMGASPCMNAPLTTTKDNPVRVRYLLHAHAGPIDADRAKTIATAFAARPAHRVVNAAKTPHVAHEIEPIP